MIFRLFFIIFILFTQNAKGVNFPAFAQQVSFKLKKPEFGTGLNFYDTLYKQPSYYPGVSSAGYLNFNFIYVGLDFGLDYYRDSGVAATSHGGMEITRDPDEKTDLTLIPLRLLFVSKLRPLGHWVTLDFGTGIEYLYAQESRASSGKRLDGEEKDVSPFVSRSWKPYYVLTAGIDLSLNFLDKKAIASLKRTFGISNLYLSSQIELVRELQDKGIDFSRRVLALGFTFATGS